MKKMYEAPVAECKMLDSATFLESSGESGSVIAPDIFDGGYGESF